MKNLLIVLILCVPHTASAGEDVPKIHAPQKQMDPMDPFVLEAQYAELQETACPVDPFVLEAQYVELQEAAGEPLAPLNLRHCSK